MRPRHVALPLLALLAGCGLLFAEVEIPSVTVTLPRQDFTGTPAGAPLVKEVSFDVGANLPFTDQPDVSYELRLTRMLVTIVSGSVMGDFGDIASVTLSVLPPPGQTLPEESLIASYAKAPPPADQFPTTISVAGHSNLDLAPYVSGNTMTLKLTATSLTGAAIPDWRADVGGEFYLKARVEYGDRLARRQ
jgi:hypothetical protein